MGWTAYCPVASVLSTLSLLLCNTNLKQNIFCGGIHGHGTSWHGTAGTAPVKGTDKIAKGGSEKPVDIFLPVHLFDDLEAAEQGSSHWQQTSARHADRKIVHGGQL